MLFKKKMSYLKRVSDTDKHKKKIIDKFVLYTIIEYVILENLLIIQQNMLKDLLFTITSLILTPFHTIFFIIISLCICKDISLNFFQRNRLYFSSIQGAINKKQFDGLCFKKKTTCAAILIFKQIGLYTISSFFAIFPFLDVFIIK